MAWPVPRGTSYRAAGLPAAARKNPAASAPGRRGSDLRSVVPGAPASLPRRKRGPVFWDPPSCRQTAWGPKWSQKLPPFFSPGAFFPRSVAPCLKEPGAGSKATQRIRGERFSRLPRRSAHQHGRDTAAPLSCWRHASRGREGCRGPERWPVGPVQGRARGDAARSAALVSEETVASRRMLQSLLRHKRGPAIPACRGAARRAPRRPRPGVAPTEGRARGSELQDAPRGSRRGLDAVRPPH